MVENKWNPKCKDILVNLEMEETKMHCYFQTTELQTTNLPFVDSYHNDPYNGLLESP